MRQRWGIVVDGQLVIVSEDTPGAKPVNYAPIPEFDQLTQAVYQDAPLEYEEEIWMGVVVVDIEPEEGEPEEGEPG